jgi:hypothetical protein
MAVGIRVITTLLIFLAIGCAEGHCRRQAQAPADAAPLPVGESVSPSAEEHVFVYKYDGSLQCGMGKAIPLDAMAKELSGVPVFSSVKKSDGLMHIQVCGSISGKANVYEVPTTFLKQAESKGFKKWTFE